MITHTNHCRICGYYSNSPPWGEDGRSPSYNFCACCGVEFGNEDYTANSARSFRNEWIARGMPWDDPAKRPAEWEPCKQMQNIPTEFI